MSKKTRIPFAWLFTPAEEWWISKIIVDESGDPSAKRIMGLSSGMALIFALIWSVINPESKVDPNVVQALTWICIGALGFSTADKFSPTAKILTEADTTKKAIITPTPEEARHDGTDTGTEEIR